MIFDNSIEIKITKRNIEHFSMYYRDIKLRDIIDVSPENLQKNSNIRINVLCDVCGISNNIKNQAYTKNINSCKSNPIYTCDKCSHIKNKASCLEVYGEDHYSKTDEWKDRTRKTCLEKYGEDHYSKTDEWSKRFEETCLEKYGVENPFMDSKKIRESFNSKYGVDHPSQVTEIHERIKSSNKTSTGYESPLSSPEIRSRINTTMLRKYGSIIPYKSEDIRSRLVVCKNKNYLNYISDNISLFKCDNGCDHNFEMESYMYHNRLRGGVHLCTVCNPIGDSVSIKEKELFEYISSIYSGEIIRSYRDGLEIDIYLPELNIGFEFNGLYWHSEKYKDKNYHLDKTNHFKEKGIRIIHIWEDDWVNKTDILKSQISNMVGETNTRIFARKCEVRVVGSKLSNIFLYDNHIQGGDKSVVKLGLFCDGDMVSIMTFNKFEGRNKMGFGEWNLSRFCNVKNYSVVGGSSKLLSYFIKENVVSRIISYADADWSVGNLYKVMCFEKSHHSNPDYKYVIDGVRNHKQNYKKKNLGISGQAITESVYMRSKGYYRIWDCGKIKFTKHVST